MQKRRRKIITVIGILAAVSIIILSSDFFKGWLQSGLDVVKNSKLDAKSILTGKEDNKNEKEKEPKETLPETDKIEDKPVEVVDEKPKLEEKFYELKFKNGSNVKVIYEENGEERKFKQAQGQGDIYFDISPEFNNMVLWDKSSQDMMLVSIDGTSKDITKPFYKTNNTKQIIQKENQLKKRPDYVWCATPKFISEGTIAYVSQLPLISRYVNSVWVYEIQKDNHRQIFYSGSSSSIEFDNLNNGALNFTVDGKTKKILPTAKVVNQ